MRLVRKRYDSTTPEEVKYRREVLGEDGYFFQGYVPCGQCYACKTNIRNQWSFRLKQEAGAPSTIKTFFVTLTRADDYNDVSHNLVNKVEIQQLNKNLRKAGNKYKFYAIGEYGTKSHRAHYHILFFCQSDPDKLLADLSHFYCIFDNQGKSLGKKGHIDVEEACPANIHYITHYHVRPKIPSDVELEIDDKGRRIGESFALCSQGLGMSYMTPKRIELLQTTKIRTIHDQLGNTFNLPRYYRKKYNLLRLPQDPDHNLKEYFPSWCKTPEDQLKYKKDLRTEYLRRSKKYNYQEKF